MSLSNNPAFVLKKILHTEFEPRPIPEIGSHDVLVQVKKTGDLQGSVELIFTFLYTEESATIYSRLGPTWIVLGHESSGIIHKVGSSVSHLKAGDRVTIEPGTICRKCDACKEGRYQLCPDYRFSTLPPHDGTLARYYAVPSDLAYPLPPHLTFEDGAMMEPLSVAVHAVSKLGCFKANQSIIVFGCGPIGILCMAVAKAIGASRIIAVDIASARLEFAKSYAATDIYQPPPVAHDESSTSYSERSATALRQQLGIAEHGPNSIDLVVDASGAEVSIQTGIRIVKTGGTYVQVGMGESSMNMDTSVVLVKELVVKGSCRYGPGDYPLAIALVAKGRINLKPLVTHRFSFEDCPLAFQTTRNGRSDDGRGVIKTIVSGPGVDIHDV